MLREDVLIKETLCRGLTDEKEQTRNNLGRALPEKTLTEGELSQAEVAR